MRGFSWLCCTVGSHFVSFEGNIANQYRIVQSDHLYPVLTNSYPNGNVLFWDDNTSIQRVTGFINMKMMWVMRYYGLGLDLNPNEHLWERLDWCFKQHCPPSSLKHQMREYVLEELYLSFTLVESIARRSEAFLATTTFLKHFILSYPLICPTSVQHTTHDYIFFFLLIESRSQ